VGTAEYDFNVHAPILLEQPESLDDSLMVLMRPELRRIEEIALGEMVFRPDSLSLLLTHLRREVRGWQERQDLHPVVVEAESSVEIEEIFFTDLRIGNEKGGVTDSMTMERFPSFPLPIGRDLRKFRLEAMLKVMDCHDVGDFGHSCQREGKWIDQ
jgi:hypothetical protein